MIVFPPSDPLAHEACTRVQDRYAGRTAYRVVELDTHVLPGTRSFVVWTHDQDGHSARELAEFNPATGRWLLLDLLSELGYVSVATARRFLEGGECAWIADLQGAKRTPTSFGYLLQVIAAHESEKERRQRAHEAIIA